MKTIDGFTLVEVIVAVTLFVMFIGTITSAYSYISWSQSDLKRYSVAASIAKSNLNKYKYKLTLTCANSTQVIDLMSDSSSNKQEVPSIGFKNFKQSVTAQYSRGCNELPIVVSKVEYDSPGKSREITFAAYGDKY